VHALDIAKAIRCVLAAPRELVHGEVYNVGATEQNYRVREIAEIVSAQFPGCELTFGSSGGDNRSYRVSFEKINNKLPGFSCDWDARLGAHQLYEVSTASISTARRSPGAVTPGCQLQHLINTGQADDSLFWSRPRSSQDGHRFACDHRPRTASDHRGFFARPFCRRVHRGRSDRPRSAVQPVLQPSGRHAARDASRSPHGGQVGPLHRRRDRRHHR
jgi:hypothetical protein